MISPILEELFGSLTTHELLLAESYDIPKKGKSMTIAFKANEKTGKKSSSQTDALNTDE